MPHYAHATREFVHLNQNSQLRLTQIHRMRRSDSVCDDIDDLLPRQRLVVVPRRGAYSEGFSHSIARVEVWRQHFRG